MSTSEALSIKTPARLKFAPEQINLMRDTVAKDCTEPEFHFFLEVCARYEFNPFLGEIYAAKMGGKNGGQGRVVIIVGRNGWIKEANRHPNFRGLDGDVVRESDDFRIVRKPDGTRGIIHETQKPSERGKIVGAWAEVRLEDKPAVFFYAPWEEYAPSSPNEKSPWLKQKSVMILKCAQVAALRLAFNIGGVYDEAEMAHLQAGTGEEFVAAEPEWGENPDVAAYLQALVRAANEAAPGSWMPEKVRLRLEGQDEAGREALVEELVAFVRARGGAVPDPEGEPVDGHVVS